MAEIDVHTEILEDFDALLEASTALRQKDNEAYDHIAKELETELASEYTAQLSKKVRRWVESTVVQHFYDKQPVRYYIQAKMLYRDGFHEATIMLCRTIAEMVCYDRLDGATHPFGSTHQVEKRNFRELLKWLHENDSRIDATCFSRLNELYDIGNNYIHPKSGQTAATDSIKALSVLGEALHIIYGLKRFEDLIGRTVRSAYIDFPDINSGQNFLLTAFATPKAAENHAKRIKRKK